MRHSAGTAICAAAVSCLAGVFANDSAKAEVFDFTFVTGLPNSTGTFTTGAPSSTDPGFDLITGVTFDQLHVIAVPGNGGRSVPLTFSDLVGSSFPPGVTGSAFDPTTLAFVSHVRFDTSNDIGLVVFDNPVNIEIDGPSFSQGSSELIGDITQGQEGPADFFFSAEGALVITPGAGPSVPEPATWAMMLIGLAGLSYVGLRTARMKAKTA